MREGDQIYFQESYFLELIYAASGATEGPGFLPSATLATSRASRRGLTTTSCVSSRDTTSPREPTWAATSWGRGLGLFLPPILATVRADTVVGEPRTNPVVVNGAPPLAGENVGSTVPTAPEVLELARRQSFIHCRGRDLSV
jgi:hypothetical protein